MPFWRAGNRFSNRCRIFASNPPPSSASLPFGSTSRLQLSLYETLKALYSSFLHTIGHRLELHYYLFGSSHADGDDSGSEWEYEEEPDAGPEPRGAASDAPQGSPVGERAQPHHALGTCAPPAAAATPSAGASGSTGCCRTTSSSSSRWDVDSSIANAVVTPSGSPVDGSSSSSSSSSSIAPQGGGGWGDKCSRGASSNGAAGDGEGSCSQNRSGSPPAAAPGFTAPGPAATPPPFEDEDAEEAYVQDWVRIVDDSGNIVYYPPHFEARLMLLLLLAWGVLAMLVTGCLVGPMVIGKAILTAAMSVMLWTDDVPAETTQPDVQTYVLGLYVFLGLLGAARVAAKAVHALVRDHRQRARAPHPQPAGLGAGAAPPAAPPAEARPSGSAGHASPAPPSPWASLDSYEGSDGGWSVEAAVEAAVQLASEVDSVGGSSCEGEALGVDRGRGTAEAPRPTAPAAPEVAVRSEGDAAADGAGAGAERATGPAPDARSWVRWVVGRVARGLWASGCRLVPEVLLAVEVGLVGAVAVLVLPYLMGLSMELCLSIPLRCSITVQCPYFPGPLPVPLSALNTAHPPPPRARSTDTTSINKSTSHKHAAAPVAVGSPPHFDR